MKRQALSAALALALCSGAQAQSNEELKSMLDQALKTIDDLQGPRQGPRGGQAASQHGRAAAAAAGGVGLGAGRLGRAGGLGRHARRGRAACPTPTRRASRSTGRSMLDAIYDFKRMNPDWNATLRPSQIPVNCPGGGLNDPGCGRDGAWIFSARQSSLGLRSFIPTSWGLVKTDLSFDLFGSDGSTTIHWLSIWAELGMFGAGQTYSNFMDIDVFPNTIDYWGPSGMVFVRNPQLRITPWSQDGMGLSVLARSAELGASTPARSARSRPTSAPASPAGTGCPT